MSRLFGKRSFPAREAGGWILATVSLFVMCTNVHIFGNLIFLTYFMLGAGQMLFTVYGAYDRK